MQRGNDRNERSTSREYILLSTFITYTENGRRISIVEAQKEVILKNQKIPGR